MDDYIHLYMHSCMEAPDTHLKDDWLMHIYRDSIGKCQYTSYLSGLILHSDRLIPDKPRISANTDASIWKKPLRKEQIYL